MELIIAPKKVFKVLTTTVICLLIASIAGQFYKFYLGYDRYLVTLFDLDMESNIPSWYSTTTLLFCSFLLAIIAYTRKRNNRKFYINWVLLSIVFLLLSIEEAIGFHFHIHVINPLLSLLNIEGVSDYSWILLSAVFFLIFALAFMKFLVNLSGKIRTLFIASGAIYVGGALCMEFIVKYYAHSYGKENIIYAILANIEETLEMVGILIFIYALMSYIVSEEKDFRIGING